MCRDISSQNVLEEVAHSYCLQIGRAHQKQANSKCSLYTFMCKEHVLLQYTHHVSSYIARATSLWTYLESPTKIANGGLLDVQG